MFCKHILEVHRKSSNIAAMSELGTCPLHIDSKIITETGFSATVQVISGLGNPHELCGPLFIGPSEHVERF